MMMTGIMGGTFDPIHMGHLIAAERARETLGLQEVWFLPSHIPPHKRGKSLVSGLQRLDMVRLATQENPAFRVNDFELRKGGVSYSIDTVTELKKEHPDRQFVFIIGADMVVYLPKWYRIEDLVKEVRFAGLSRPGTNLEPEALPDFVRNAIDFVPMPLLDISSTDIRDRLKGGQSVRYLLPDRVIAFIEENGLYES